MAAETSTEPMLDLAFVRGRAIWIPRENTEEEQNKEKNSKQRGEDRRHSPTTSAKPSSAPSSAVHTILEAAPSFVTHRHHPMLP